jgi:adhesin/invasin
MPEDAMRSLFSALTIAGLSMFMALFLSCDLGEQPIGPTINVPEINVNPSTNQVIVVDSVTSNMRIFIEPSELLANNEDYATVTVQVYDDNHNPVDSTEVRFSATHGVVQASDTTDSEGKAQVTFWSVPVNSEAWVYARATLRLSGRDTTVTVGRSVTLSGLTVTAVPSVSDALFNQAVPLRIQVLDAGGEGVSNERVSVTFAARGSSSSTTVTTKGDGTFDTTVTLAASGSIVKDSVVAIVSALGASDTVSIRFYTVLPAGAASTVNVKELRVFSSRSQLKADNTDQATITAILIDPNNNPLVGDTIAFSADPGIIDAYGIVDASGRATVTLRSSPVNDTCTIWAEAIARGYRDSTQVTFSGVDLKLTVDPQNLKIGQYATVEALLTDASGNPVGGDAIQFQTTNGSFEQGASPYQTNLNPIGRATVRVTAGSASTIKVWASANNSTDSVAIMFTTNTLTLSASPASISADGVSTSTLTATYRDGSGNLVNGAAISFATNAGTILTTPVNTVNGVATSQLRSATFATFAIVQANAPNGSAQDTVTFTSSTAFGISLAITPDNVSVNGGTATLIATVKDANGNMVNGAGVNFKIIKGPGGDEYISKPVVVTQDGIAQSTLLGGSLPSSYRGCEVAASVGAIADTSKLTISGEPYVITVSRPQDDTVVVPNAGEMDETTFDYFVGAVVQDINGNPVADNTEVHFSAVVSGMAVYKLVLHHWAGVNSNEEIKAILAFSLIDVPFEDINNNLTMDPNIDLKLDYNDAVARRGDDFDGDGVCDYSPAKYDVFYDFNGNGICDYSTAELVSTAALAGGRYYGEPYYIDEFGNEFPSIYADLNQNGIRDTTELRVDHNGDGFCDLPANGDFRYWVWEMRAFWRGERFDFEDNDFAVVIDVSAPTKEGVAYARLTYPRQLARRLFVTVNAEANGIRDKDGERFKLPVIVGGG